MNWMKAIVCMSGISCFMTACSLDNYEAPTSAIYGSFIDQETGELIEQDIVRGTQIEYQEGRFVANQYMVVKPDGTYRNNLLFNGVYKFTPVRGNFEPIDPVTVEITRDTKLDFQVIPFLRIKHVSIFKNGNKVKAIFRIQQTGFDNVLKVGLYAGADKAAGATVNQSAVEIPVGATVSEDQSFTIEMDIVNNPRLKKGFTYYFRVGAVIDAPEAKFNYAPAVELTL
jgi:hypothetical protein